MKLLHVVRSLAVCVVFGLGGLHAQTTGWQPSPGHAQLPIWPKSPPDAQPVAGPEHDTAKATDQLIAGRHMIAMGNVSRPTITVYSPQNNNTGAAVVVFPGGGYQILAMDLEGSEVCDWLASRGITGILLKYRVPHSGPYPRSPMALEDVQRAVSLVRFHAVEWHIDSHKIGVLGFSAGGHLSAAASTHYTHSVRSRLDPA